MDMPQIDPGLLMLGGGVFLLLALVWYTTGRFFLIGWLVKILWLPLNVLSVFIWVFAAFGVNVIFDILRSNVAFSRVLSLGLIGACYYVFEYSGEYFVPLLIVSLLFFYLLKFGLNENRLYGWIFYSPKARRTPPPKPDKEHKKLMEDEKKAELLPRPLARLLVEQQSGFATEGQIIERLDEHLQRLIKRT